MNGTGQTPADPKPTPEDDKDGTQGKSETGDNTGTGPAPTDQAGQVGEDDGA